MRIIFTFIIYILWFLLTGCKIDKREQEQIPNIILILPDDLGVPQLGCYGSDYYQTPNIDNLAKNGVIFTNAYAAAVCSPTRASIVTGKYPARLNITDYIPGNQDAIYQLSEPKWQKYLALEEITIAEVLKENGYKTAWFGKCHLSKGKTPPICEENNPDKQGFDEIFITYKPSKYLPLGDWQIAEKDAHNVDTITNRSIDFINHNANNPFFLVVSHNSIHDPLMEKEASLAKFQKLKASNKEENNPTIAAMIERLDNSVGRILKLLVEVGIDKNTIVLFYSDNGAKDAYAKQTPLRKGKGWLYEGGIRVPLIIQWKGRLLRKTAERDNKRKDRNHENITFFFQNRFIVIRTFANYFL